MAKHKATPVDPELEEKMSRKLEKDFEGNEWYGAQLEAEKTPLIDPGTGKPIILRMFDFKFDPTVKRMPTKQELFTAHAKQVMTLLWADGLRPFEGENPRVTIDAKKRTYRIVVVAEPRLGTMVVETPQSLNKVLSTARKK